MYERGNTDEPTREGGDPGQMSGAAAPSDPDLDAVPVGPELMATLSAVPLETCSDGTLLDGIAGVERLKCWAEAVQASMVSEFATRHAADDDTGTATGGGDNGIAPVQVNEFAADELALTLHVARGTAERRIDYALRLTSLGMTHHALETGRIGLGVAHRIVDGLTADDDTGRPRLTGATLRLAEKIVLEDAEGRTPGQVQSRVAHTVLLADPAATAKRHAKAVQDRTVRLFPEQDGMATLSALLPADDAVLVMQNLRCQADAATVPGDTRTQAQRLADAFVDLHVHTWRTPRPCLCTDCPGNTIRQPDPAPEVSDTSPTGGCTCGGCTCNGARPRGRKSRGRSRSGPRVRVVVAATTLQGLDSQPGDLAGYGPIPADVARRLAADPDGTWQRLLTDPATGALLDVGRTCYRPPAALDEFVRTRDRTCRFPGCRMPAQRCDLDHVRRYPDGPTSRCNLCTECRHHHRLKHDAGWEVHTDPDHPDRLCWTTPTRRVYYTEPRPPLEPG